MERGYCYLCGAKVTAKHPGMWRCPQCKQDYYANPKATVEAALFNDRGEILLAERGADPAKGKFDLPGGFIDFYETVEEALARELKEELSLITGQFTTPRYLLSYTSKYPWGKETYELISLVFVAKLKTTGLILPKDDVADIKFVQLEKIDSKELSHPKLLKIIQTAAELY